MSLRKIKLKMVGVATLAVATVAMVFGGFSLAATPAFAAPGGPLVVACDFTQTGNTVTWRSVPSGGTLPYSYYWAGDQVGGSTSSSVPVTYATSGVYHATTLVVDNAFNSGVATCSTTVPPPATSTDAGLTVTKTVDNATSSEGGMVHYTVTVAALGPATSPAVNVQDLLPSGLTLVTSTPSLGTYDAGTGVWTIGDMAPSSTAMLGVDAMVASGTAGLTITNTAMANESASVNNPAAANASSSALLMIAALSSPTSTPTSTPSSTLPSAGLEIMKTIDNASPLVGSTVNYMLTVTALGPATSTEVMVNDLLPTGLVFMTSTPSAGTYDATTGVWTIGDMSIGTTNTLGIQAMIDSSDTVGQAITNTAMANESSSVINPDSAEASSSVTLTIAPTPTSTPTSTPNPVAGIMITKTIDKATSTAGGVVNYALAVQALGPATSTEVMVNDVLPTGLAFVSATPSLGTYNATTGVWTIGMMPASSSATLGIQAMINSSDTVGQMITNQAAVMESSGLTNPNAAMASSSAMLTIVEPPTTTPTSTPTSTPPVINYPQNITIANGGAVTARGMIVTNIGPTSFQAQIWGITYTVNFANVEFLFKNDNSRRTNPSEGVAEQMNVGDVVNVSGFINRASPFTINAEVVRDLSIINPRPPHYPGQGNGNGNGNGNGQGNGNGNGNGSSTGFQNQLNAIAAALQALQNQFNDRFGH